MTTNARLPQTRSKQAGHCFKLSMFEIFRCSSRNLTVVVLDENDNAPVFSSSGKSIALREDTDIGTVVSSVHATDRDSQLPPAIQLTEVTAFVCMRRHHYHKADRVPMTQFSRRF